MQHGNRPPDQTYDDAGCYSKESFPPPHPSTLVSLATTPPPVASAAYSPSPVPSSTWPAPPSGLHIPSATDNTSENGSQPPCRPAVSTSHSPRPPRSVSALLRSAPVCTSALASDSPSSMRFSLFCWYNNLRPGQCRNGYFRQATFSRRGAAAGKFNVPGDWKV